VNGYILMSFTHINFQKKLVTMQYATNLRKAGVKVIGRIQFWNTSANLMRISEKADLRAKLAASIMVVMEQLKLDGLFLQWYWPGCPEVKLKIIN
jgi:GH18 family chitinase